MTITRSRRAAALRHKARLRFCAVGICSQDTDGDVPTRLDHCNGHFGPPERHPEGEYHHHAIGDSPISPSA